MGSVLGCVRWLMNENFATGFSLSPRVKSSVILVRPMKSSVVMFTVSPGLGAPSSVPSGAISPLSPPGFPLGPGPWPRVLWIQAAPDGDPLGAEVAVEVDAAPVQAHAEPRAVRVQVVHDPEVEPGPKRAPGEAPRDVDPLAFVAVDASDYEHLQRAREVAEAVDADRPAPLGVAENAVPLLGRLDRRESG